MSVSRRTIPLEKGNGTIMLDEHHHAKFSFLQIDLFWPGHVFSPDALNKIIDVFEDNQLSQYGTSYSINPTSVVSPKFLPTVFSRISGEVLTIIQDEKSYERRL